MPDLDLPPDPHRLPPRGAWFARDAERHLLDRPRFCPMCGEGLDADGGIRCRRGPGIWERLELLPGSVVTSGWAWLRLGEAGGPDYAELLRGDMRQSHDWRRFQVIWRHIGAAS